MLNKHLSIEIITNESTHEEKNEKEERIGSIYVSANKLITKYKTIIKETNIEYKNILNYTFAIIERKVEKIILEQDTLAEKVFTRAIMEILEFTYFLYSVSPRANTTIKLCQILRHITKLLNSDKKNINIDNKHLIYKYIFDNTHLILWKNKAVQYTQIETLYLLIALRELGREYLLDANVLYDYFGIIKKESELVFKVDLNYFSIIVLLFYIKDKVRYNYLKDAIKKCIIDKFDGIKSPNNNTENSFLLFDVLSCPHLNFEFKKEVLSLHGISDDLHEEIITYRDTWYTKWTDFNFFNELEAKKSKEVY